MPTLTFLPFARWPRWVLLVLIALLGSWFGLAASWASSSPTQHPITPSQVSSAITYYYQAYMQPENAQEFDLRKEVLRAHYLLGEGVCPGGPSNDMYLLLRRDNLRGQYILACEMINGHHWTQFIPRQYFGYLPAARSMNFVPVLHGLGNRAAVSMGIAANQHGPASQIVITKTSHSEEADIAYSSGSSAAGVRQLKELKLVAVKGAEKVDALWYGG